MTYWDYKQLVEPDTHDRIRRQDCLDGYYELYQKVSGNKSYNVCDKYIFRQINGMLDIAEEKIK